KVLPHGPEGTQEPPLRLAHPAREGTQTHAGSLIGTPGYMAPEQVRGEGVRISARSDVFGLGAILCEVLTGAAPFAGAGPMDVLRKTAAGNLAEALARLDACGADVELIRLAKSCLA